MKQNTFIEFLVCPWMKTWKFREIKPPVLGHTAKKRRRKDLNGAAANKVDDDDGKGGILPLSFE